MAETIGDFLLRRLAQWGVRRIYGFPGDGTHGVIEALARGASLIEFVPVPQAELATVMASAHG